MRHLQSVLVPHQRLNLGQARLPRQLQLVLSEVTWVSLKELGLQEQLDLQELRHFRAAQELIKEGKAEGRRAEAASMTLRQLSRRCGPLSEASTARIQALPLEWLEPLADALLDFSVAANLAAWLVDHDD